MRFCPKCNTRLKQKQEEKKPTRLLCEKCGYSTTSLAAKAETKKTSKTEKSTASIKVLGEEDEDIKPLPTTNIECPKCKHDTAAWWMLQTRGGDEPTTQFYRCVKCNHTWRHYA
jgi:DNA-directed RNA polymerase subunit M